MSKEWDLAILHLASDAIIALCYFTIPATIFWLRIRKKGSAIGHISWSFILFILFCGLTHASNIVMMFHALYWVDGFVKAATALVSLWAAVLLIIYRKEILKFGSHLTGLGGLAEVNDRLDNMKEKI